MASYTNFCCRSGGNNLNAGTVTGDTTEPATTPLVTYTGGDYNATTNIYNAPAGADMTEAVVGRFASVYVDGDTSPTANQYLVGRISSVNAGTRAITLTAQSLLGTEVATGTGTRSMRIGGAWAGPSGASGFPVSFLTTTPTNGAGDAVRVNLKNDQTYGMTATITRSISNAAPHLAGYSSAYGDGGRATIDGGASGASYNVISFAVTAAGSWRVQDVEFRNNGDSGISSLVSVSAAGVSVAFIGCVFHGCRGNGLSVATSTSGVVCVECEFYDCNQSNTTNTGGATVSSGCGHFSRCTFHDNAGSNSHGLRCSGATMSAVDCVFSGNGSYGILASGGSVLVNGCDFYDNGDNGFSNTAHGVVISNSNFVKNVGFGVATATTNGPQITLFNCGFGAGTQANGGGDVGTAAANEVGSFSYPADTTPWADPDNGDFRITHAAAKGAGRGTFLQTAAGYAGTVGYPDVGAAQHQDSGGSGGSSGGHMIGGGF